MPVNECRHYNFTNSRKKLSGTQGHRPYFFGLASNAFPNIGSVGRSVGRNEKKKKTMIIEKIDKQKEKKVLDISNITAVTMFISQIEIIVTGGK